MTAKNVPENVLPSVFEKNENLDEIIVLKNSREL